jgi:hypothetical protein
MFPESPSPSTQHATKMLQGLVSFPDQFQTNNGSGLLSPWHHLVHVLLLCTWTSYLFAKWQMCLSSNSSSLWVAWIVEMLLALPDLFSVCEFTLFLFAPPTPRPSLEDRLEEKPVESLDPTVHVLITFVHQPPFFSKIDLADISQQNMRRKHRGGHGNDPCCRKSDLR